MAKCEGGVVCLRKGMFGPAHPHAYQPIYPTHLVERFHWRGMCKSESKRRLSNMDQSLDSQLSTYIGPQNYMQQGKLGSTSHGSPPTLI